MSEEINLTPQEEHELSQYLRGNAAPQQEENHNTHTFLANVATAQDTTKLGYLKDEEVGVPKLPVRTFKELELFCNDVASMDYFGDYFKKMAEIQTATSLSREGKLIELAVITRRQLENVTKPKKENKGWFKRKGGDDESE